MNTDRIEAAVQAEARRIKAHLSTIQRPELETVPFIRIVGPASVEEYVESLANHLVRNRLQIEVLQVAALVETLEAARPYLHHTASGNEGEGRYHCNPATCPLHVVEAALAQAKDVTP